MKHIYRYTSLERLRNVLFGKHYFYFGWSNCKPNGASQFKMDDVSFSKLITYKIWLHKWILCTISILMGWFWNICGDFLIFLLVALQFTWVVTTILYGDFDNTKVIDEGNFQIQTEFMMQCICSVIDHIWHPNIAGSSCSDTLSST